MKPGKRPVALSDIVREFVKGGQNAQAAVDKQLHLGAPFGWLCPRCGVINAEERQSCVGCATVRR